MKDVNDSVYKLIWFEANHAKFWEQYISLYCSKKQNWRKYITITTLMVSSIGASSWMGWDMLKPYTPIVTGIALALVATLQVAAAIADYLAMTPQQLQSMISLRVKYLYYFYDLENLFQKYYCEDMPPEEALAQFDALRKNHTPNIESIKEDLNIKENKNLKQQATEKVDDYLRPRYPDSFL